MAAKVTILEKAEGVWTPAEVNALARAGVEVEVLGSNPCRIVAGNKPPRGGTFQSILGHQNFVSREVDYSDRWWV